MENLSFYNDERMNEFSVRILSFRLPRWDQIPTLGLYMDQVVTVIEQALSPVIGFDGEAIITSSMINNYVKLGMVQKPDRKKYNREHIASLIVITILKQSTAIGDIRLGIDTVLKTGDKQTSYDSFCEYVEKALGLAAGGVLSKEDEVEMKFSFRHDHLMISMAVCAFATQIITSKILSLIREDQMASEEEKAK